MEPTPPSLNVNMEPVPSGTPATRRADPVAARALGTPGMRRVGGGAATPAMRRVMGDQPAPRSPATSRVAGGGDLRSPAMSRAAGSAEQRAGPAPTIATAPAVQPSPRGQPEPAGGPVRSPFVSRPKANKPAAPVEEALTPYEAWTSGELAPRHSNLQVGGQRNVGSGPRTGPAAPSAGERPSDSGLSYLGPDVVPGETREEREMRLYLARGQGTAAAHAIESDPFAQRRLVDRFTVRPGTQRGSVRPGSVRPGSQRPGAEPAGERPMSFRPGSVRPGSVRPGSMRPDADAPQYREMFTPSTRRAMPPQLTGDIGGQFEGNSVPLVEGAGGQRDQDQLTAYDNWTDATAAGPDVLAEAAASPKRERIFDGVSSRARTTVYQFIWECKLRVFTEGEILEQELRKDPDDRVYLKLLQPQSAAVLDPRASSNPVLRFLTLLDGTMPAFSRWCRQTSLWLCFIDALLRGAGQVMMANNPITGAIAIGALFASSAWYACMACFGLVFSTSTAYLLGVNRAAWQGGLFGYNGFLIGAALAALMTGPWEALTIPMVAVGATFTSILNLAFGNMLAPIFGAPPLALAFVFMTWIIVGGMYNWNYFNLLAASAGGLNPALPGKPAGETGFLVGEAFQGWIRGCGAIYFAGTTWSGCMIVFAMSFFSRISAVMMLLGSFVGLLAGWFVGVSVNQLYSGGFSYDAALAAIGVGGLFFVITWKVAILAAMAAFLAAWLHSALTQWLLPVGLPSLNLAFDLTVIFFVMIQFSLSGIAVIPLATISQPEAHYRKTKKLAHTLRALAAIERIKEEQLNERQSLFAAEWELFQSRLRRNKQAGVTDGVEDDLEAQWEKPAPLDAAPAKAADVPKETKTQMDSLDKFDRVVRAAQAKSSKNDSDEDSL